ncbi:thioredoxin family protein [Paracoccus sp. SCSIO 75233]|uniref:DUF1223 domain-containing protein n=1 Tax=Paracoccus sp. SCSIO 75233 TaxID=3017782 RepID=UPI0022F0FF89|nr:DUF1223 domain-containing protein [Paracoccus sp. SCSIO 75233]WBU53700.1 DUF1223 domain-containing protein [Paracoccus sp. SCSIO 75233]
MSLAVGISAFSAGMSHAQAPVSDSDRDYGEIMDDVEAVFDAMNDAVNKNEGIAPDLDGGNRGFVDGRSGFSLGGSAGAADAPQPRSSAAEPRRRQGPEARSPVVVELFTAMGCAACPPAEQLLADLAGRRDVLPLSWHIDYWDYLGWPDGFARPEFARRQKGYNAVAGSRYLFTPQVFVGGEVAVNDVRPAALMAAITDQRAEGDKVAITRKKSGDRTEIELTPQRALPRNIAIVLIRYVPERVAEIKAGENAGRRIIMRNVVMTSEVLANWDGNAPLRLKITLGAGQRGNLPGDTRHALLVQKMNKSVPGEIFAALRLD